MRIDSGHARVTVAQHPTFGKIQDRGGRHIHIVGHISVAYDDICVIFGAQIDIGHRGVIRPKIALLVPVILKMAATAIR